MKYIYFNASIKLSVNIQSTDLFVFYCMGHKNLLFLVVVGELGVRGLVVEGEQVAGREPVQRSVALTSFPSAKNIFFMYKLDTNIGNVLYRIRQDTTEWPSKAGVQENISKYFL